MPERPQHARPELGRGKEEQQASLQSSSPKEMDFTTCKYLFLTFLPRRFCYEVSPMRERRPLARRWFITRLTKAHHFLSFYTAQILLGPNADAYDVLVDTGSSDLVCRRIVL